LQRNIIFKISIEFNHLQLVSFFTFVFKAQSFIMPRTQYTKKEVVYVDPLHTAKTLVLVYLSFSVPIVLLALFVAFVRDGELPGFTVISALILNALVGFGLLWLACKVYNWVAGKFGGIEVAVRETTVNDTPPTSAQD
jgi:hypothetical protein